jgi:heme exporter protein A
MLDDLPRFPNLRHRFDSLACMRGELLLFRQVSFELAAGELVWLKGPNGVGKSSLLRQLAGLLPIEDGRITWDSPQTGGDKSLFHYLGHTNALDEDLSVEDSLSFWQRLYRAKPDDMARAIESLRLSAFLATPCRYLSSGQRRRTALARLLLCPRPVWLLDEPLVGLDTASIAWVSALIAEQVAQNGSVILISHQEAPSLGTQARVLTLHPSGVSADVSARNSAQNSEAAA